MVRMGSCRGEDNGGCLHEAQTTPRRLPPPPGLQTLNTSDALAAIREKISTGEFSTHVAYLADFISSSERGIIK
jgi:hypothetical protein